MKFFVFLFLFIAITGAIVASPLVPKNNLQRQARPVRKKIVVSTPTPTPNRYHQQLEQSWEAYKKTFIMTDGQVVDPQNSVTTSEGQSYALLRAVFINDQDTFNRVWEWTQQNMQTRPTDKLFGWKYQNSVLADTETATDADLDIAAALLLAGKKWTNEEYTSQSRVIIQDIWKKEVITQRGIHILAANSNGTRKTGVLVNPSYFSPSWYRLFADLDPEHPWKTLVDDTYTVLQNISTSSVYGSGPLIPDWVILSPQGAVLSAVPFTSSSAQFSGYDAFRIYFRIALDVIWNDDPRAKTFLSLALPVFEQQWQQQLIPAVSQTDGKPKETFTDMTTSVGALSTLYALHHKDADSVFKTLFEKEYKRDTSMWGNEVNYYRQNWAWFVTALVTDQLAPI